MTQPDTMSVRFWVFIAFELMLSDANLRVPFALWGGLLYEESLKYKGMSACRI